LHPVRMRTGVHQPVPIGRTPTQGTALLHGLRAHRRQRPMPSTRHLPLRDRPVP
jgi:hypothetical protein